MVLRGKYKCRVCLLPRECDCECVTCTAAKQNVGYKECRVDCMLAITSSAQCTCHCVGANHGVWLRQTASVWARSAQRA